MPKVVAQDALALEADLLGDALRGAVVGIGDEVDALQPELIECVARQNAQGARTGALAPSGRSDPVADSRSILVSVDTYADSPTTRPSSSMAIAS